ncbi:hydroxylamine reductase [Candidatus Woesearchaeota archaeon]|nr:hydroxylamine reductase [Candidatus Woesearchaeota archaeon]
MFCYQCEETMNGSGCTNAGMCGKKGAVADAQDRLIYLCKQIAKKGSNTEEESVFIMRSMFSTITNVNFDLEYFNNRITEGKKFIEITDEDIYSNAGVQKEENVDLKSLKETIIYGLKGLCAYLDHAYVLGYKDDEIFSFVRKLLITTTEQKSAEELTAMVLKVGEFGVKTMALLDKANTETYGNPEPTKVNIGVRNNPGILISGHDLKDMHELLEQTKGTGVDIYTHGEMLPANSYPAFKKYDNLVGNYGGSWWKQKEEFERFNGVILMTTNCLVPPKDSYKDRVYTTGLVGFEGLKHIPDRDENKQKDFSALIEHAKSCNPPEQLEEGNIMGGFAHNSVLSVADKVVEAVKSGTIKKFIVMAGCDGRHKEREYYTQFAEALPKDTIILTAGCAKYRYNKLPLGDIGGIPRVLDAGQCNDSYSLIVIAQKLAEAFELDDINKLPVSYNIAWYEQKAVLVLLALLSLGVKNIHLGPKLPAFVSPEVLKVLVDKFGIKGITNVETDMEALV